MSKKRDFSLVVWAFGWLLSLAILVRKKVEKLSVPFEAFEWLVSDRGESTIERIMMIIKEGYEAEQKKLLGHVVYEISTERLGQEYSPVTLRTYADGKFVDVIEGLPTSGLYLLEFEILTTKTSRRSVDQLREQLAKDGKRFATLSEAAQFMLHGQNGSSVTNWERVYALGTMNVLEGQQPRYCYVHNNMDGRDYGISGAEAFVGAHEAIFLIVKSSTFIRDAKAA